MILRGWGVDYLPVVMSVLQLFPDLDIIPSLARSQLKDLLGLFEIFNLLLGLFDVLLEFRLLRI